MTASSSIAETAWRRPGWRGRIGVIQPSPGVMLEAEWPRWLPEDVLFPVMRVAMGAATAEGYRAVAAQAPAAARELAKAGAGVVAFACTVGSLFDGLAAERSLLADLAAASGLPALSLGETSVAALQRLGCGRIAVLSPYSNETTAWVERYLSDCGIGVAGFVRTPVDIVTVGNIPADQIAQLSVEALSRHPDADGLWIPCTAIRTLDAVEAIESTTGKPVVSGSQALLWRALDILGLGGAGPSCGRLFRLPADQTT